MQSPISVFSPLATLHNIFGLMKLPFFNGDVDANDILPHNAPCADIQVPTQR